MRSLRPNCDGFGPAVSGWVPTGAGCFRGRLPCCSRSSWVSDLFKPRRSSSGWTGRSVRCRLYRPIGCWCARPVSIKPFWMAVCLYATSAVGRDGCWRVEERCSLMRWVSARRSRPCWLPAPWCGCPRCVFSSSRLSAYTPTGPVRPRPWISRLSWSAGPSCPGVFPQRERC